MGLMSEECQVAGLQEEWADCRRCVAPPPVSGGVRIYSTVAQFCSGRKLLITCKT